MSANSISWKYREPEATDEMIAEVESKLGVRYPDDFRSFVPTVQGAAPKPSTFFYEDRAIGRVGGSLSRILSFSPSSSYYVLRPIESFSGEGLLPAGVVPFGIDGGGDMMAFDFRKDAKNPPVVYVAIADAEETGERHIYPLAKSFTEFLGMLTED